MGLTTYHRKRNFRKTAEPKGTVHRTRSGRSFVIQKHDASRLHYDFRLELDGVLLSWAVPKGPSLDPADKRLAVHVEDHPVEYGKFEGTIPEGEYGGGTVMLWDRGTWEPVDKDPAAAVRKGKLTFRLDGERLRGEWTLTRMHGGGGVGDEEGKNWLLIKRSDEHVRKGRAITDEETVSVDTGRTMQEIASANGKVWKSGRAQTVKRSKKMATTRARSPRRQKTSRKKDSDTGGVPGARAAPLPRKFSPQLCTLVDSVPTGANWIHEIKFDGYRFIARKNGPSVKLITRTGKDWTARFAPIAKAIAELAVETALIDGEACILSPSGRTSFQTLQQAIKSRDYANLAFFAFDLPYCDGYDLTGAKLVDRKAHLERVLHGAPSILRYSDHVSGHGGVLRQQVCDLKLEGAISKLADAPYEQRRSHTWVKTKCSKRQEFIIVGWSPPSGSRKHFGSLLLAAHDEHGRLVYTGRVGTGFNHQSLKDVFDRMQPLRRTSMPLAVTPPRSEVYDAKWVTPGLVGEIEFTEWTEDGRLRHPVFMGLREDKEAKDVKIETTRPRPAAEEKARRAHTAKSLKRRGKSTEPAEEHVIEGVRISSPEREVYPEAGLKKIDIARYYAAIAPLLMPYVEKRPLSTVRCPQGRSKQCFFQKHTGGTFPRAVGGVMITEKNTRGEYITIDTIEGLVSLVQFGVLELHPWGSRVEDIEHPDLITFDFDPGEGVDFEAVKIAAIRCREILKAVKLKSFIKTSGGKGLHVCVPIRPGYEWDDAKAFAKAIAVLMERQYPDDYTSNLNKADRKGKIFVDYLRNGRGATSVAPYSTRARSGAPVSMPIRWEDVKALKSANQYTVANALEHLKKRRRDPWADYFRTKQSLPSLEKAAERSSPHRKKPGKKGRTAQPRRKKAASGAYRRTLRKEA